MIKRQELVDYILSLPGSFSDFPFDQSTEVFKTKDNKMFALLPLESAPPRISLKCDPGLAEHLRSKYESVMPGYHLNKKHWNTIICSGQLSLEELTDLIMHSFTLVNETK